MIQKRNGIYLTRRILSGIVIIEALVSTSALLVVYTPFDSSVFFILFALSISGIISSFNMQMDLIDELVIYIQNEVKQDIPLNHFERATIFLKSKQKHCVFAVFLCLLPMNLLLGSSFIDGMIRVNIYLLCAYSIFFVYLRNIVRK